VTIQRCAMGERCTQHQVLRQPAKLSRYSADDICGPCRERERYAQVGDTKNRSSRQAAVGQGNIAPRVINEHQAPRGNALEQGQPSGSRTAEAMLVARVYERKSWLPEEWRRLCEHHGEDPDSEVLYVRQDVGAGETSPPDMTTVCGKPGVAISGYVPVCEECWARIKDGEPPRVCEPWDDDLSPPEERYESLLHAAQTLLRIGVSREEEIYPTLVWAARSWELGNLAETTRRFVEAEEDTVAWEDLKGRFLGALGAFEPVRIVDGVLVLQWVPVAVVGAVNRETGVTEAITVEVRRREVKPTDVARQYAEYLRRHGIPEDAARGATSGARSRAVVYDS
jgi:hypothetical protein